MSTSFLPPVRVSRVRPAVGVGVALLVAALGLLWAKWLPCTERTLGLLNSGHWKGTSVLLAGDGLNPFGRAWAFTVAYSTAVWKALAVALVISACADVLVPRRWLLRTLGGRTTLGGSVAGGMAALPAMMCTCCSAPLTVTMRGARVPTSAALAFWLGNPVLNPAVLVFLALLAPWPWVAVRVVLGLVLVLGVSTFLGHLARGWSAPLPAGADRAVESALGEPVVEPTLGQLPGRLLRSFARLAVVLVPEYLLVVFLVGLVGPRSGGCSGTAGRLPCSSPPWSGCSSCYRPAVRSRSCWDSPRPARARGCSGRSCWCYPP